MDKFIAILIIISIFFFVDSIYKKQRKNLERQLSFWLYFKKSAIELMENFGRERAECFLHGHKKIILDLNPKVFDRDDEKEILAFIFKLGDNYNEEEMFSYLLNGRYKEEDLKSFEKVLIRTILNPAV